MKKNIKFGRFVLIGFAAFATLAFLNLSKKESLDLQNSLTTDIAHADTPAQPVVDTTPFISGDGDGGGGGDGV
jgi:hypothetical protein